MMKTKYRRTSQCTQVQTKQMFFLCMHHGKMWYLGTKLYGHRLILPDAKVLRDTGWPTQICMVPKLSLRILLAFNNPYENRRGKLKFWCYRLCIHPLLFLRNLHTDVDSLGFGTPRSSYAQRDSSNILSQLMLMGTRYVSKTSHLKKGSITMLRRPANWEKKQTVNHLSLSKREKQLQFNFEKDILAFQKLLIGVHCACNLFKQAEAQALKQRVNESNALGQLFVLFSAALLCA